MHFHYKELKAMESALKTQQKQLLNTIDYYKQLNADEPHEAYKLLIDQMEEDWRMLHKGKERFRNITETMRYSRNSDQFLKANFGHRKERLHLDL